MSKSGFEGEPSTYTMAYVVFALLDDTWTLTTRPDPRDPETRQATPPAT
jgi:hypothetical protein